MRHTAIAFATIALTAGPGWGQGIDMTRGGPIQLTSKDGIEWRQAEQMVIARGDARAVREGVTVTADRLIAWYRHKGGAAAAPVAATESDTGGNEVYRLRAEGNVHIFTVTDQAWGDRATYDLDEAVMVMTGGALRLTTPTNTLTARDTLEYWSQKHMVVARGNAVVVTNDARRVAGDTLVAYTTDAPSGAPSGTVSGTPAPPPPPAGGSVTGAAGGSVTGAAGKLDRVEAFGHVSVRTLTDIVTGDRAVYVPDTGIARLGGHVRITRGLNQMNGSEALVYMKTGIATLLAGETGRVEGLIVPNDASAQMGPNQIGPVQPGPNRAGPAGAAPAAKPAPAKP